MDQKRVAKEEQLAYAALLDIGMKAGLVVLIVTFLLYLAGVPAPAIPVEDLPRYWTLPVDQYLAQTGVQAGWSWVGMLDHGDFLNFLGIALLAGVTVVCYLRILPILARNSDYVYLIIAGVEVLVLVLAASGLMTGGAH